MKTYTTIAIISAALFAKVNAHGFISDPPATYKDMTKKTSFDAKMTDQDAPECFKGKKWNDSPEKNTETFTQAYKEWSPEGGKKSLKDLVEKLVPTCGNSMENGTRQDVSGKSTMNWENQDEGCGFVNSHHGPCEVWIDDTLVLHDDDCRAKYTGTPASIPVDYSLCKGDCLLKFYWLALHEAEWQIYKQCVPISNAGGQGPPSSDLAQEQGPGQVYTEPEQEQQTEQKPDEYEESGEYGQEQQVEQKPEEQTEPPAPEQKPEEQTEPPAPEQKPEEQTEPPAPEQKPEEQTEPPAPEQKPEEQTPPPAPEQKPYEVPETAPVDDSPAQEGVSPSPKMCEV